jgi:hypothetical protein
MYNLYKESSQKDGKNIGSQEESETRKSAESPTVSEPAVNGAGDGCSSRYLRYSNPGFESSGICSYISIYAFKPNLDFTYPF